METTSAAEPDRPVLRGREVLVLAAWLGLAAGLLEVLTKLACTAAGLHGGLYRMSRHFLWLIPVTDLLVFLGLGLASAAVARVAPRAGTWLAVRVLGALALVPALLVAVPGVHAGAWFLLVLGVAFRLAPKVARHERLARRLVARSLPALAAAVVALAGWVLGGDRLKLVRESSRPLPPASAPNILLVVMDTVRADRLSLYGYDRPTTPTLVHVARRGIRFDAAQATAPWTLPSHGSLFTGRLPDELGAGWTEPLDLRFPTLAGFLGAHGYATAGFVGNTLYCAYDTGLAEGFTHYEDYDLGQMEPFLMAQLTERAFLGLLRLVIWAEARGHASALAPFQQFVQSYVYSGARKDAARINRDFLAWLDRRDEPRRPFFAFLNYIDAHDTYFPPRPTDYRFGLAPSSPRDVQVLQNWESLDKRRLDAHDVALASDCYDDCIRYEDEQLYYLFADLDRRGLLTRTLLIVTADHGESFGEHGLFRHGNSLYRPEIHVPLLIVPPAPGAPGAVVREAVSLRDLPATVADLVGLGADAPFPGRSLARTWRGTRPAAADPAPVVSQLSAPNPVDVGHQAPSPAERGPIHAVITSDIKVIFQYGHEEVFDLSTDPGERRNLAGDDRAKPLLDRLRRSRRRRPFR